MGPESASDGIASETFLVAFRERERFQERGSGPRPWLLGIATNLLRRARRDEERYLRALARATGVPAGTVASRINRARARVRAAVEKERDRERA